MQLHVNAAVVEVADRPSAAVEVYAARTGMTLEDAMASPGVLTGSVDAIVEKLQTIHEQYGVSYWVIHARNMDAFSRVIARL